MFLNYLGYIIRHKWFVFIECWRMGVPFRGLMHDISKFRPSEFVPYMKKFWGPECKSINDLHGDDLRKALGNGYYKEKVKEDFDYAWLHHQRRNRHHWQYWVMKKDVGPLEPLDIPEDVIREMIADWAGAGRAIKGYIEIVDWYEKNKDKIIVTNHTRIRINKLIEEFYVDHEKN
jgi:hypothetical protein